MPEVIPDRRQKRLANAVLKGAAVTKGAAETMTERMPIKKLAKKKKAGKQRAP